MAMSLKKNGVVPLGMVDNYSRMTSRKIRHRYSFCMHQEFQANLLKEFIMQ